MSKYTGGRHWGHTRQAGKHAFCQNLLSGIHDGRIGTNWSPKEIMNVQDVDDNNLILLVDLFLHSDEMVRLEC